MANTIEFIIKAIDQASAIVASVEAKITGSNEKIGKSYDDLVKQTEAAGKSTKAFTEDFENLAKSLQGGSKADIANAALAGLREQLDSGKISAETYNELWPKIAAQYGVAQSGAQQMAAKIEQLNADLGSGKISAAEYEQGLGGLSKEVSSLGEKSNKATTEIGGMQGTLLTLNAAVGVAQVGIETFKKVWDLSKEGAAVQRIGEQFNAVAADFGVSGDAMVAAMDKAARGTVDDEELMTVATRAMTQGTITSQDQLVKFTEIARASAVRFGGDTAQALQSILYATEVGAARQLKATIGVVDFTKAYDQLAAKMGKRKGDLTEEEQLQARVNAVLDKGADLVKKVGDSGDDAATKMQRFETQVKDLQDTLATTATNALLPMLDGLDNLQVTLNPAATATDKLKTYIQDMKDRGVDPTSDAFKYYTGLLQQAEKRSDDFASTTRSLSEPFRDVAGAMVDTSNAAKDLADKFAKSSQGIHNQSAEFDGAVMATKRYNTALAETAKQLDITSFSVGNNLTKSTAEYTAKQDELQKKSAELAAEIEKLEAAQGHAVTTTNKHALSSNEAALAMLQLSNAQKDLSKATDPTKQAELAVKIDGLKEKLNNATGAVTGYIDNSKKIGELKGQYDDINKEIANNAAQYEEANKRILLTIVEQQLARDGWTTTEVTAYTTVARQLGLFDNQSATLFQNIMNATGKLESSGDIDAFTRQVTANAELMNRAANEAKGSLEGLTGAAQQASGGKEAGLSVKVTADMSSVPEAIARANREYVKPTIALPVKLDTTESEKAVQALHAEAGKPLPVVPLKIDTKPALDPTTELFNHISQLHPNVEIKTDTEAANKQIDTLLAHAKDSAGVIGKPITPIVEPDFTKANTALENFGIIPKKPVVIPIEYDPNALADIGKKMAAQSPAIPIKTDDTQLRKQLDGLFANPKYQAIKTAVSADTAGAKGEIDKYQEKKDKAALPVVTPFKADTMQASGDVSRYDFQLQSIPPIKQTVMSIIADEALAIAQNLITLQSQFKDKSVTWTVNEVTKSSGGGSPVGGAQAGADFVVPPGFSGDRFPLMVSSGERVIVMTPAQQQGLPGTSALAQRVTNNVNNFYDTLATKMWIEKQRQDDLDALVARM